MLIAGYFRDTWIDKVATSIAIAGVSVPHYWLGMVLVIIFSVQLNWLPAVGAGPGGSGAWGWDWEHMKYLILPAITTSVIPMGPGPYRRLSQICRSVRAKGLRETYVFRHVIKPAPTALAVMGLQLGYMLGGSILIETVFSGPARGSCSIRRSSSVICRCCRGRSWCWRCSSWRSISWSISRKPRSTPHQAELNQ